MIYPLLASTRGTTGTFSQAFHPPNHHLHPHQLRLLARSLSSCPRDTVTNENPPGKKLGVSGTGTDMGTV
jgi:hypothetical protein